MLARPNASAINRWLSAMQAVPHPMNTKRSIAKNSAHTALHEMLAIWVEAAMIILLTDY